MAESLTYEDIRVRFDAVSELVGDWQGLPVPLPGQALVLTKQHPLRPLYRDYDRATSEGPEIEIVIGGPNYDDDDTDEVVVNSWYCRQRSAWVYVYRKGDKAFCALLPVLSGPVHGPPQDVAPHDGRQ